MVSLRRALGYGVVVWLIPFVVAFAIFPLRESARPLFESIMPVAVAAGATVLGLAYLRRAPGGHFREGVLLGGLWLVMCIAIDAPLMLLGGPMRMTVGEYLADIGVTYLLIPVITTGLGAATGQGRRGGHGVALALALIAVAGGPRRGPRPPAQDPLAEPFAGVTTDGTVIPGLFPLRSTGVSTAPVRRAAERFVAALTEEQRGRTVFPVDDDEWRRWNNVHRYTRQGVSFREMTPPQREAAFALLGAGLSATGLRTSRDIMRLNGHLAEVRANFEEYGEDLYFLTVMGEPTATGPWGWQLDGHHLIVNYFVLGDQVVMTPTFMGSEPVRLDSGAYAGTAVLQAEQDRGLALMRALTDEQRRAATILSEKTRNHALAQAFRDNLVLDYAGIRATALDAAQRALLLDLVAEYVGKMADGHARVRLDEVRAHLDDTYFAWIGEAGPDAVFYYRVQSPVILIEFDHQSPVALPGPRGVPTRTHVHTVVRTPNGNDYGKDLLRQHYQRHRGDARHGHPQ